MSDIIADRVDNIRGPRGMDDKVGRGWTTFVRERYLEKREGRGGLRRAGRETSTRRLRERQASSSVMAAAASSSSPAVPPRALLDATVHQLQVACAELQSLHETRAVYEKSGAIFFRTTVKAAAKSQQKELEKAKARAKKAAS